MLGLKKHVTKKQFFEAHGYEIDFNQPPRTFNQKIQFRKIYDNNNPLIIKCADKYKVRDYVKEKIGSEHLAELYLVTEKLTYSDYEKLPTSFVIKTNHGAGNTKIVYDKTQENFPALIKYFNKEVKRKYGNIGQEYFYNKIPPLIIAEELLLDSNKELPTDYKFHCFNNAGDTKIFVHCIRGRFDNRMETVYDENWQLLPLTFRGRKRQTKPLPEPPNFAKMKEIAKKLSEDFAYVRVDLYNLNGKIYFGELTFTPGAGTGKMNPQKYDYEWGSYWNDKWQKRKN